MCVCVLTARELLKVKGQEVATCLCYTSKSSSRTERGNGSRAERHDSTVCVHAFPES